MVLSVHRGQKLMYEKLVLLMLLFTNITFPQGMCVCLDVKSQQHYILRDGLGCNEKMTQDLNQSQETGACDLWKAGFD